jgi:Zn-dependent peptidase ImmA (M78 family)
MTHRIDIPPNMLIWARMRAGMELADLLPRFPKLSEWESRTLQPTLKQLEDFANAVHLPIGYLFLPNPPDERLPIKDFRTIDGQPVRQPSPNLLDTLYTCQERQGWYREFALTVRQPPSDFIGSASLQEQPEDVAARIASKLDFKLSDRIASRNWEDALRLFIDHADKIGVLVMVSSVVKSNTKRKLDPNEFRGFALADNLAPLIFINGADSKSGQMFTLAHELAHLWLGESGVSDASASPVFGRHREEIWCNAVAAELLVPLAILKNDLITGETLSDTLTRLTKRYKVSKLVILRRLLDAEWITRSAFDVAWTNELAHLQSLTRSSTSGGGDFYRTTLLRVSRRFARALVESTLEGQTLYRDAFRMLGVAKTKTFNSIGEKVGVML